MMAYHGNNNKTPRRSFKCSICRTAIINPINAYQTRTTIGIVCDECLCKFSLEDIELILKLFIAYGGYFGKFEEREYSVTQTIKNLINYFNKKKEKLNFGELNMRLLHRGLLYGITPENYIKDLLSILEE